MKTKKSGKMDIAKLKELAQQATGGPWYVVEKPLGGGTWVNGGNEDPHYTNFVCECFLWQIELHGKDYDPR